MLCDICNKEDATVHYTQVINGDVEEVHLCSECSKKQKNYDTPFSLHKLLTGIIDTIQDDNIGLVKDDLKCDSCGLSYSEFKQLGRFGCKDCYTYFDKKLEPLIKGIQGKNKHIGKIPKRAKKDLKLKIEIEEYRDELDRLVKSERFEEAAVVRDKIKELEANQKEGV